MEGYEVALILIASVILGAIAVLISYVYCKAMRRKRRQLRMSNQIVYGASRDDNYDELMSTSTYQKSAWRSQYSQNMIKVTSPSVKDLIQSKDSTDDKEKKAGQTNTIQQEDSFAFTTGHDVSQELIFDQEIEQSRRKSSVATEAAKNH